MNDEQDANHLVPSDKTQMIPEQIVARPAANAEAWLIDPWGRGHAIAAGAMIGRDTEECALLVLHPSVSTQHARVERSRTGGWRVVDLGSLNGTLVNGRKVHFAEIVDDDLVQLGEARFRFTSRPVAASDLPTDAGRTVRSSSVDLPLRVRLRGPAGVIEIIRRAEGGVAELGDRQVRLANLEFGLLRALIARSRQSGTIEEAFVSSRELLATLAFRSRSADNENVRELVRRVREKLRRIGAKRLIQSERGSGYRLAWTPLDD